MKYYCRDCGEFFSESEKIAGKTRTVYDYTNDSCPECRSEDIIEADEKDICAMCGWYHAEGDDTSMKECFNDLYCDARGVIYLMYSWGAEKFYEEMADLSDSGDYEPLKSLLWRYLCENNEIMEFMRFMCDFDDASSDRDRDWNFKEMLKGESGKGGKYGELYHNKKA